ncbi:MAG: NAD-dependent epimerase/dehydratase family protein, partial [Candidatus Zixiibacteriota bacterium]
MSGSCYRSGRGIAITGAAGFIGSTFLPALRRCFPDNPLYALDALTYAGLEHNLNDMSETLAGESAGYSFHQIDITDSVSL